ncbi:hypothetical protein E2C01_071780 [Portunus trituberculatus]|uniref:Uncharacterized protein n=1 Tax=Portunus trituberculatus TaxID=210409 RepID=A0A5B7I8X1_PORTR|nr:hypothetical protein [Portunus trituberculatus]
MLGGAITERPPCSVPSHTKWGHQRERRAPGCIVSKRESSEGEQAISFPSPAIHHIRSVVWRAEGSLSEARWIASMRVSRDPPPSVLPVYVSFHLAFTVEDKIVTRHRTLLLRHSLVLFLARTPSFWPPPSQHDHISATHRRRLHTVPLSTRYPI